MNFIVKSIRRFPYLFLTFFFALGIVNEYNFQLGDANIVCVAVSFVAALVMFVAYMLLQRRNIKDGADKDVLWFSFSSMLSLLVLFFFLGGSSEHLCHPISAGELESHGATEISARVAKITSVPKLTKNGKVNAEADVFFDENENWVRTMITINSNHASFKKGDLILFSSSLKTTESGEKIGFNYDTYLRKKGVEATAFVKQYRELASDDVFSLETSASNLNMTLQKSVANDMATTRDCSCDDDARSLITAITLGTKTEMDDDLKDAYSKAGASHLLAVSGLHVGIIILIVECLVGMLIHPKKRPYLFATLLLSIIWSYAFLTGLAASVVRTSLMYTVYRVAILLFSKPNPINVVSFTAFAMLVYNPFNIFDLGFQLSFSAVYSILIFGQPLIGKFEERIPEIKISKKKTIIEDSSVETGHAPSLLTKGLFSALLASFSSGINKLRTYTIGSVAISIAAQILTTPIIILTFHSIPILSIGSSLFTIPLVTVLIPVSFAYYVFFALSTVLSFLKPVADGVLYVSTLVAEAVNAIVYYTADISFCTVDRIAYYHYDVVVWILIFLLIAAYVNYRRISLLWISAAISVLYFVFAAIDGNDKNKSRVLAVYNVNGVTAVNRMTETNTLFGCTDTLFESIAITKVLKKAGEHWTNSLALLPSTSEKSYFAFGNHRVYILSDKNEIRRDANSPLETDILILANNVAVKVEDLKNFRYRKIIVDGSNKYYVSKKWGEEREKSGAECHIVRFDGSWRYEGD